MWTNALDRLLAHLFRKGELTVRYPDGHVRRYGDPAVGEQVAIQLHGEALPRRIVLSPEMAVGEAYTNGRLTIENDDLYGVMALAISNIAAQGQPWFRRSRRGAIFCAIGNNSIPPIRRGRMWRTIMIFPASFMTCFSIRTVSIPAPTSQILR